MDRASGHFVYEFGDFRVDPTQRLLLSRPGGQPLPLSSRAFDALLYFLEHRDRLLDKSDLMAAIWPNVVVEENNLNQHISALRRVLGESPGEHRFIVTVPGRGYRFVADVKTVTSTPDRPPPLQSSPAAVQPTPEAATAPSAPAPAATPAPDAEPRSSHHSRPAMFPWGLGGIAALLLIGAVFWLFRSQHPSSTVPQASSVAPTAPGPRSSTVSHSPGKLRLAILPFRNLSPDPTNAFFADGLHEEILSTLGERLRSVEVISRTTMMSDHLKAQSIATVASELGATHVIEGSVRREGKTVRLTLQLINAGTDEHMWSKSYDRTLTSALTLQSEVANEVASQLSVQLAAAAQGMGPPTANAEAYDLYLKAVLALRVLVSNSPRDEFQNVDDLLTRAIALDPQFAIAYAQRARTSTLLYIGGQDTSESLLQHIRDDLVSARTLAPQEPFGQAAEGFFLFALGENERALATFDAAEAAGVSDPVWLLPTTRLLLRTSRVEAAVRLQERLLELDPANPIVIVIAVDHFRLVHRPVEVLRIAGLLAGQYPELAQFLRATTLLAFTGATVELRRIVEHFDGNLSLADIAAKHPLGVRPRYDLLRYEHRYEDLNEFLRLVPPDPLPYAMLADDYEIYDVGELGTVPNGTQFRGWTALLLGDRAAAARAGRALLEFLRTKAVTKRNEFFIHRLDAEGQLFSGRPSQAIEAARASLALVPRARDAVAWVGAAMTTARIYAWAGDTKEADGLLEQLAVANPGLPPAMITRDPLYTVPLANDAQFQSLVRRLETQMSALNLH